jgi:phytoene/squalene synthetase
MTSASPSVSAVPSVAEVTTAYRDELGAKERAALWSWVGFTATFAAVRAITYSIRDGKGPFHNLSLGGAHLHHYMWGIAMVSGVGAAGVLGEDETRRHPVAAITYGAGLALIVDEFALLLDLRDVYWAKQGRVSVDIGVGLVAAGGTTFSAIPILRRLARNRRR